MLVKPSQPPVLTSVERAWQSVRAELHMTATHRGCWAHSATACAAGNEHWPATGAGVMQPGPLSMQLTPGTQLMASPGKSQLPSACGPRVAGPPSSGNSFGVGDRCAGPQPAIEHSTHTTSRRLAFPMPPRYQRLDRAARGGV